MSNKTSTSTGGFSLSSLLLILFITLKLCGVINWSWWWVLSPLWISFLIFCVIVAVVVALTK